MRVALFVGPTLPRTEAAALLPEATCLPPVAQGDVYRAARLRPDAIGIIDGYFSGAPSVWHKEILWALSEGVPVFGSASLGALRAAELHLFGMRGVGRIFEAFRDGVLEDDDEVAVVHGPAELDFVIASQAMANIRATLARAEAEGILRKQTRLALEATGKALFFPQRSWPALLESARQLPSANKDEIADLERWLPIHAIDQKREDALEMLAAMRSFLHAPAPVEPTFRFERTHLWNNFVATLEDEPPDRKDASSTRSIIDELRLQGPIAYQEAKSKALLRLLADREFRSQGSHASPDTMRAAVASIRSARSLFSRDELMSWIARNDLDDGSFERLVAGEARLSALAETFSRFLDVFLLDELRLSGVYADLATRARRKAECVRGLDVGDAGSGPVFGSDALQLRLWFFEERLGEAIPEDIEAFAGALGLSGADEFDRVLLREWLYCRRESMDDRAASEGTESGSGL